MRLVGSSTRTINISPKKNVLILLGDNGFGKTTVLDALATAMAPYPAQFPGIGDFQLSDLDVHIDRHGKRAKYLTVSAQLSEGESQFISIRHRKGTANPPKPNYERLKQDAISKKESIIAEAPDILLVHPTFRVITK